MVTAYRSLQVGYHHDLAVPIEIVMPRERFAGDRFFEAIPGFRGKEEIHGQRRLQKLGKFPGVSESLDFATAVKDKAGLEVIVTGDPDLSIFITGSGCVHQETRRLVVVYF